MSQPFSKPPGAIAGKPEPFTLHVPDKAIKDCHGLGSLLLLLFTSSRLLTLASYAYLGLALFAVTNLHILFVASHNTTSVQSFNSSCMRTTCTNLHKDLQELSRLSKVAPSTYWNQQKDGTFGVSRDWIIEAKDTWTNKFDWRTHEEHINSFPNFKMNVQHPEHGRTNLHFAALFSRKTDAVPVIFMHGWPGSFLEFLPMMDLLKEKYTPQTLPYHVIVPSLPGYGLSSEIGIDNEMTMQVATQLLHILMMDLGFSKGYIAQGGDVGSGVATQMSDSFEECKAYHVNVLGINFDGSPDPDTATLNAEELERYKDTQAKGATGFGYAQEHGTRPATIGLVLSASPVSLLAWVGEKLVGWAAAPPSLDTILGMVSFYWFTETFPRSLYPYRSIITHSFAPSGRNKPLGYSCFAKELGFLPEAWAKEKFPNLVQYVSYDKGGHFAALELPSDFLNDVEDFIKIVRDKGIV